MRFTDNVASKWNFYAKISFDALICESCTFPPSLLTLIRLTSTLTVVVECGPNYLLMVGNDDCNQGHQFLQIV